ncbi:MAG: hypothetical protein OXD39_08530 [Gemmatimonadetes bacterium]|nr:hypothetical protein [Gemmatimonadota bacterium]
MPSARWDQRLRVRCCAGLGGDRLLVVEDGERRGDLGDGSFPSHRKTGTDTDVRGHRGLNRDAPLRARDETP